MENKFEDTLLTIINDYNEKIRRSVDNETKASIANDAMTTFLFEYNNPLAALIYGEIALKSISQTSNMRYLLHPASRALPVPSFPISYACMPN